jgi:hypothetical protein
MGGLSSPGVGAVHPHVCLISSILLADRDVALLGRSPAWSDPNSSESSFILTSATIRARKCSIRSAGQ